MKVTLKEALFVLGLETVMFADHLMGAKSASTLTDNKDLHRHLRAENKKQDEHEDAMLGSRRRLVAVNPFDIVFMMDESDSMRPVQKALKKQVTHLFSQLSTISPGSRAGLVGFGGLTKSHPSTPHLTYHTALTSDPSTFQKAAEELVANGGVEPGYLTIYETVMATNISSKSFTMGFTPSYPFCVVIFTDAASNGDSGSEDGLTWNITQQMVIDALNNTPTRNEANAKGTFFAVTAENPKEKHIPCFPSYEPIALATRGQMHNLSDFKTNTTNVLNALVSGCNLAVNGISLSPQNASLTNGDAHTLRIATNQLIGGVLSPMPNADVTLTVLNGPDAGRVFTKSTDSSGMAQVSYTPTLTATTTINFQSCFVTSPTFCDTATATWFIHPNRPPLANDDSVTAYQDTVAIIVVLNNDSDPDGDPLTVTIVAPPAHGTGLVNSDGTVTYTPDTNYHGPDSFMYTVSDGNGGIGGPATVRITVTPPPDIVKVKGSGRFHSPSGAFVGDTIKGIASVKFVAKYNQGQSISMGTTKFSFLKGGLKFNSVIHDWMIVTNDCAKIEGWGNMRGEEEEGYKFMLTACKANGIRMFDTMHIKIWKELDNSIIYDNMPNEGDESYRGLKINCMNLLNSDKRCIKFSTI